MSVSSANLIIKKMVTGYGKIYPIYYRSRKIYSIWTAHNLLTGHMLIVRMLQSDTSPHYNSEAPLKKRFLWKSTAYDLVEEYPRMTL